MFILRRKWEQALNLNQLSLSKFVYAFLPHWDDFKPVVVKDCEIVLRLWYNLK